MHRTSIIIITALLLFMFVHHFLFFLCSSISFLVFVTCAFIICDMRFASSLCGTNVGIEIRRLDEVIARLWNEEMNLHNTYRSTVQDAHQAPFWHSHAHKIRVLLQLSPRDVPMPEAWEESRRQTVAGGFILVIALNERMEDGGWRIRDEGWRMKGKQMHVHCSCQTYDRILRHLS